MIVASGIAATIFLGGWLLPFGIHPPGWVDPFRRARQDRARLHLLHLDPRDALPRFALRPADVTSAGRSCSRSRP